MIAGHRKDVAAMSYLCLRKCFEAERHTRFAKSIAIVQLAYTARKMRPILPVDIERWVKNG